MIRIEKAVEVEMSDVASKLYWLRRLFLVYLALTLGIDVFFSLTMFTTQSLGWEGVNLTPGALLVLSLLVYAVLFALGWSFFHQLLRLKHWARIVLLVIGWMAVIDAISSVLLSREAVGLGRWLGPVTGGLDWGKLIIVDRVKDLCGFLYWGYAILVLQFNPQVKKAFTCSAQSSAGR